MGDASFRMLRTYTFREYEKLPKKKGGGSDTKVLKL
jgi:hypothetical protein